ncbi:MAG: type II toxin-antitoxin system RelE/ParE family toxin [Hyphomicrobiales bacterium]
MRVVYLRSTTADLKWLRKYYLHVFPEGKENALKHVKAAERLLLDNPWAGRLYDREEIRLLNLPRTPFAFIYRVVQDRIEILRVIGQRSDENAP